MLASCQHQQPASTAATEKAEEEDTEAKAMLQGVWQEELTEEVVFRAEGDTIYYPDPSDQPAHFRVVSDSLEVGTHRYPIVKQTEHQLWFCNQSGDVTKLVKSEEADDTLAFVRQPAEMLMPKDVLKTDSVVNYEGQRYHWYVAVNPTRYRVTKTVYNGEGVAVDNVYYDNIIHISLYQGQSVSSRATSRRACMRARCHRHSLNRPSWAICNTPSSTVTACISMPRCAYPTRQAAIL